MSVLEFIQTKLTKSNGDTLKALVEQTRDATGDGEK
jgi:hypothetical protein